MVNAYSLGTVPPSPCSLNFKSQLCIAKVFPLGRLTKPHSRVVHVCGWQTMPMEAIHPLDKKIWWKMYRCISFQSLLKPKLWSLNDGVMTSL